MSDHTFVRTARLACWPFRIVCWPLLVVRRRLAATDARAVAEGWTITKLPWGGRVYRDPRLDQLAREHMAQVLGPARAGRRAG